VSNLLRALPPRTNRRAGSCRPAAWLHESAAGPGAALRLPGPAPRRRPEALAKRLEALQARLDEKKYAEMVADVTAEERRLAELSSEMFPTTRLQLSFGLHVLVTMGTLFALGFYGLRYSTGSDTWVGGRAEAAARRRGPGARAWGGSAWPGRGHRGQGGPGDGD
jgi:hypothetical protein